MEHLLSPTTPEIFKEIVNLYMDVTPKHTKFAGEYVNSGQLIRATETLYASAMPSGT